jgi:Family of unknown function (DUF5372)
LPAGWTDVAPADPFAVIADGRCPFTINGLLALADLISRLASRLTCASIRQIMRDVATTPPTTAIHAHDHGTRKQQQLTQLDRSPLRR